MSSMLFENVPHQPKVYCQQGDVFLKKGAFEQALSCYDNALSSANATEDVYWVEYASLCKGQVFLEQGKQAYETAKAAGGDDEHAGYEVALAFMLQGLELLPEDEQLQGWVELLQIKLAPNPDVYLPDFTDVLGDSPMPDFSRIENLVLQGGGVKGIAYLGTLQALCHGTDFSLDNLQRVGGTSAGAIQALSLALGYDLETVKTITDELDFEQILDGDFRESFLNVTRTIPKLTAQVKKTREAKKSKGIFNLMGESSTTSSQASHVGSELSTASKLLGDNDYGLFAGDWFREDFLEPLIQAQCGGIQYLTFEELHNLRCGDPEHFGHLKDLYMVGVNLTLARSEVFSYETTPHAIISDAIRISMSIPFVFSPHKVYQKIGGRNAERTLHPLEHLYVDGGVMDNYPVWLFDREKYLHPDTENGDMPIYNDRTLGLKITSENNKAYYEGNIQSLTAKNPEGLFPFALQLLNCLYKKESSDHDRSEDRRRTIYVDNKGVNTTEFDVDDLKKHRLIQSGQQAVMDFVKRCVKQAEQVTQIHTLPSGNQQPLFHYLDGVYDSEGQTPLHRAAGGFDLSAVEMLLALGVPPEITNQANETVLDFLLGLGMAVYAQVPFLMAVIELGICHTTQSSTLLQIFTMAMGMNAVAQEDVDRVQTLLISPDITSPFAIC